MQAVLAPRGDARTFLTHFVGSGLDDDRTRRCPDREVAETGSWREAGEG